MRTENRKRGSVHGSIREPRQSDPLQACSHGELRPAEEQSDGVMIHVNETDGSAAHTTSKHAHEGSQQAAREGPCARCVCESVSALRSATDGVCFFLKHSSTVSMSSTYLNA